VSGSSKVTLRFNGLTHLQAGNYVLQLTSSGLTDVAGNALDERFYIPFPGLYTTKGQNFIAEFTSTGTAVSPLRQYVPPPEVLAAQKHHKYLASQFSVRRR
jgi:hypothetical protein